jgi:hypothetical protein
MKNHRELEMIQVILDRYFLYPGEAKTRKQGEEDEKETHLFERVARSRDGCVTGGVRYRSAARGI